MRNWLILIGIAVLGSAALLVAQLLPPKTLRIAAGPEGGAYIGLAREYADILARDGLTLSIVETVGSGENARLISDGAVEAAILQGGIPVADPTVEAIGTIFYEPLIFLIRRGSGISRNAAQWENLRISSGVEGSGTHIVYQDFERAVGRAPGTNTYLQLPYDEALASLILGEIDIAVFVAPLDAPYLVDAYYHPEIEILFLEHADAISRRLPYADMVVVPTGGLSLEPVVPSLPRQIVAVEARLAIVADLHPALINRLTAAALELHRGQNMLSDNARFPAVQGTGLPANNAARLLIQDGPSAWHDWLPYWAAAQINRVLLLFLPFFFIVVPLIQLVPKAYVYAMRRRVWRHYPEIRRIELELAQSPDAEAVESLQTRVDTLERRISSVTLPTPYREAQYNARLHLQLVQQRLQALRGANARR